MYKKLEAYSPLLLKIAFVFLSLPAIFIFGYIGYSIILGMAEGFEQWFLYPVYLLLMASSIVFAFALIPSFQIVVLFEHKSLFSDKALKLMHQIMSRLLIITILFFVQMPFWYLIAQWDDAPGLIIIMGYVMGIAFTITLIASLFKRIISENISKKL